MILKTEFEGDVYTWIEKGGRACLKRGDTRVLWWGEPQDPMKLRSLQAPLAVLLELSVLRREA